MRLQRAPLWQEREPDEMPPATRRSAPSVILPDMRYPDLPPPPPLSEAQRAVLARSDERLATMQAENRLREAEIEKQLRVWQYEAMPGEFVRDPLLRIGTGADLIVGPDTAPTKWNAKTRYHVKQVPAKQSVTFDRSSIVRAKARQMAMEGR